MFRKGVNTLASIFYSLATLFLMIYYVFDSQSIRTLVSPAIDLFIMLSAICPIIQFVFMLYDRHLVKTREFFRVEGEGWRADDVYEATLVGARGEKWIISAPTKEATETLIEQIRRKPFAHGFLVPFEKNTSV